MTILDQLAVQILREFGICYFFSREVGIRTPPTPLPYWTILIFSELNFSRKELDLIGMFQNVFLMETKIKYMQTDPLVDLD